MYRFLESLCVSNGAFQHLEWHLKRMTSTWVQHFGHLVEEPRLPEVLKNALVVPEDLGPGVYKCRIVYGRTLESVTFIPYVPREVRILKPMVADDLNYPYKYEDRSALEALRSLRGDADDVLVICRGFVTDTSFSNVIMRKDGVWWTPTTYLLNGTCRQRLLAEGLIREATIRWHDLEQYEEVHLINAMLDPWNQPCVKVLPI